MEFLRQFSRIITFGGIAQGLFVVLLLNNRGIRKSRANVFLSILLIALSFSIAHVSFAGVVLNHFSANVYSFGDPTFFLIPPLLWFYTQELTGIRVTLSWRLFAHFFPFLAIIYLSLHFKALDADRSMARFFFEHLRLVPSIFWGSVVAQFSGYQVLIHQRWRAYQVLLEQEVSNTENVSISWVRFFMGVFVIINLFLLFAFIAAISQENKSVLYQLVALIFSLSVFALGYKGILQKEIFNKDSVVPPGDTDPKSQGTAEYQPDRELVEKLLAYMEENEPYLDPELTLSALAKKLTISRSVLSHLINNAIGDNFYDFVNKYRVERVKKLMTDPAAKNFNMLGIALEAGFKSKSTFNLIFKRFTGLTPTEYRRNISA